MSSGDRPWPPARPVDPRDIPAADYLVMAGGGRIVDLSDPGRPVTLRDERFDGAVLAEILAVLEAEVGPLKILVEAE